MQRPQCFQHSGTGVVASCTSKPRGAPSPRDKPSQHKAVLAALSYPCLHSDALLPPGRITLELPQLLTHAEGQRNSW